MQETLNRLSAQYPGTVEQADEHFFWNAAGDRYPYYLRIIQNLVGKIGAGIYPLGTFLPSEAALAKEYQVSIHTIRRALAYLNRMHFVKTINGRGTRVISPDKQASITGASHISMRLYLSAIQLMTLIIRPASLLVFDKLDASVQKQLTLKMEQPHGIPLTHIADCVIENTPLYPLKVILQEANYPLRWGYYFSFDSRGKSGTAHINEISLKAFACLQKGDQQGFADLLFKSYCYILDSVCKPLCENGLVRDSWLILPR
ncbi:GntR family transcriptional regulator [Gehongia tenuis]|uniref:GntR family transcriptional regulator n=1 Tax=Gehongia tenuis TaxID=2763655 RepID=A0A926D5R8_9FIRM|nr:GntR family transcriptional regulator [Gehongia tenuis]